MAIVGDTYTVELKNAHLEWGIHRYKYTRNRIYGEGYIQIPRSHARRLAIYNSNNIYYNVVNNLSHSKTNVVLMHDSGGHEATVDALRNIISYGKEYGYSFKTITSDTPVVAHGVNN